MPKSRISNQKGIIIPPKPTRRENAETVSIAEAARRAGKCQKTIRRAMADGHLPWSPGRVNDRPGKRIDLDDLEHWQAGHEPADRVTVIKPSVIWEGTGFDFLADQTCFARMPYYKFLVIQEPRADGGRATAKPPVVLFATAKTEDTL